MLVEQAVWNIDRQAHVVLKVKSVSACNAVICVVLEDCAVLNGDTGAGAVSLKVEVRQTEHAPIVDHNIAVSCQARHASSVNEQ